ncbi:hypothetical protein CEXT_693761 [Caerostris extrusa]|uniref:Uncharacterized protein n=1 Tax=Caerostris extrusa TaxID=172846 RepID=A0AAV4XYH0_CAEEX|nr:hypothetical protein CEXT_693761 [Caerostris extrusa]
MNTKLSKSSDATQILSTLPRNIPKWRYSVIPLCSVGDAYYHGNGDSKIPKKSRHLKQNNGTEKNVSSFTFCLQGGGSLRLVFGEQWEGTSSITCYILRSF